MKNLILIVFSALLLIEVGDRVFWGFVDDNGKIQCNGVVLDIKNEKLLHVRGDCWNMLMIDDYIRSKDVLRVEK